MYYPHKVLLFFLKLIFQSALSRDYFEVIVYLIKNASNSDDCFCDIAAQLYILYKDIQLCTYIHNFI